MGTWDTGPFDNDTAADWCGNLDEASPLAREQIIRDALAAATALDYLECPAAEEAIAAAAIVAAHRPAGPAINSAYAPDFLVDGERLTLSEDLAALAVRALRRISGPDSEWRELWEDSGHMAEALAELTSLLVVLES